MAELTHEEWVRRLHEVRMEPDKLLIMIVNEYQRSRVTTPPPSNRAREGETAWIRDCLSAISLIERDTTSSDHEKVGAMARIARKALATLAQADKGWE